MTVERQVAARKRRCRPPLSAPTLQMAAMVPAQTDRIQSPSRPITTDRPAPPHSPYPGSYDNEIPPERKRTRRPAAVSARSRTRSPRQFGEFRERAQATPSQIATGHAGTSGRTQTAQNEWNETPPPEPPP